MSTTADNVGLLTLIKFNSRPPFNGPACSPLLGGNCTIPLAMNAPWFLGTRNVASATRDISPALSQ